MARAFDGNTGDVITIGDTSAADITGTAWTACAWVKIPATTADGVMIGKSSSSATDAYNFYLENGRIKVDISDSVGADSLLATTTMSAGVWHHCAVVKAGTGAGALRAVLDGVDDGSTTSNRSIQNADAALTLGRRSSSDSALTGDLAECALWNVSLTTPQLLALARGISPMFIRPQNLRGYWPLWGTASPERDYTQHNNDGTISGSIPAATSHPFIAPLVRPRIIIPTVIPTNVDSATIHLTLTPSGTELQEAVDSATVPLLFTPSGVESQQGTGTEYTDSATVGLALTPSGTEFRESLDAATASLKFTPSGTDLRESFDAATVRLALTPDTHDCVVTYVPAFEANADRKWAVADPQRQWLAQEPFRKWDAVISESPITC